MKYFLILTIILFHSCISESDKIFSDGGLSVSFFNKTEDEFSEGTIYIGAIVDDVFFATDSLSIGSIKAKPIGNDTAIRTIYPMQPNEWRPNLDKVKSKSNLGCFLIKIKEIENQLFFNKFYFPNPKLDGANISVWIENDNLFVFDGKIEKQDFEIVK